ncbi:GLUG motif-containing protein, partial [Thermoproteota archaeon]
MKESRREILPILFLIILMIALFGLAIFVETGITGLAVTDDQTTLPTEEQINVSAPQNLYSGEPEFTAKMAGSGTAGDPFQITNCTELNATRDNLTAYYILMNNIDCSGWNGGAGFEPIGENFTGNFNGDEYNITDLYIDMSSDYVGLFQKLKGSNVTDLGLVGVSVTGYNYVGGLAGYIFSYAFVDNAYVGGDVEGEEYVGGLVGYVKQSTVNNSNSAAAVTGYSYIGGMVGYIYASQLDNSYASGNVTGENNVGGLVGANGAYSSVDNSYASGDVDGNEYVGGLIGMSDDYASVDNSYASGVVTGYRHVGGLVGYNGDYSTIDNSYASGDVSGEYNIGGLVGYNAGDASVDNSYANGTVTGDMYVGGLVGYNAEY